MRFLGVVRLGELPELGQRLRARAQVRAHGRAHQGWVERTGERAFTFVFDDDVQAVVPGQAVVVYDEADAQVLLSGWIHRVAEQAVA